MATLKPTSVPSKRLAETISGSASSFKLNNIEGWDGVDLTSADFGTVAYAVFRNSAGTLMEIMEFDPSTIASASITINKRGLKFTGDLTTEVAGNKLTWVRGDTIVELGSHPPQLLNSYVDLYNEQTLTGAKTVPAPTASGHIANKAYVDAAALGSATVDKLIVAATAGATIAAGNLVYFDYTDNEWKLTDADTLATLQNVLLGIAQGAGTDGSPISGGVLLQGLDTNQTGMTQGDLMYASNTAGGIASSAGTTTKVVGVARSTTDLYFDPLFYGAVLQSEIQSGSLIYAADAGANDTYVITLSPAPSAYTTGMVIFFKANTANTGAATINVNSLGAKTIKKNVSADLDTGDISASQINAIVYDGTNFQLLSRTGTSTPTVRVYTGNDTWNKPTGLKFVEVEVVGGGGGGGGSNSAGIGAGGGGGGGYSRKLIAAGSLGATETVTVGAAGTAGAASGGASGGAGGTTSFGSHLQATGGAAGIGTVGSSAGGLGGVGSSGDVNVRGDSGESGSSKGGKGGASALGGGGPGGINGAGTAGGAYGGGGGGAEENGDQAGGAGAAGVVIVKEYF